MIPFLDLKAQHIELEEELVTVFRNALRSAAFVGGPEVKAFEREFAEFCEARYCVGVNSGTDALRFSLIAAGIGPGCEVITVPNTFVATAEAVSQAGAIPAFVDVDERTCNMDPQKLRGFLENKCRHTQSTHVPINKSTNRPVRAVVPVHLYGQPVDMDAIMDIADRYHLIVIEDACQAHGAEYLSKRQNRWRKVGCMGLAAAFSFYPGKNLGACGEGGAVTTNNEEIAQKVRMLRDHGQTKKYFHCVQGYNGRLDAIQAAVLRIKLRYLSEWNEKRRQNAYEYNDLLRGLDGVTTPHEPAWAKSVYHLYVIKVHDRDRLRQYLSNKEIATGLHYPIPIHLQGVYNNLGYNKGAFPVSEKAAFESISLPMYPELTLEQKKQVVTKIKNFLSS